MPDTHLVLSEPDGPGFGQRYDLFYRRIDVGTLEIAPHVDYTSTRPSISVHPQIDWSCAGRAACFGFAGRTIVSSN
jgi:hypothetical protein